MAMEDELATDTPYWHDMLCDWDKMMETSGPERCDCEFIAKVRADERRRFRGEVISLIERGAR